MYFGKVIGTVVATKKVANFNAQKLLVVQKIGFDGEKEGSPVIAIDHVQAGQNDFVFMAKGKDAAWPIGKTSPVDMGIMGIIDNIDVIVKTKEKKSQKNLIRK